MFLGQYQHNLEKKGRISIPKKFRVLLKTGAVLTKGLDGCLFLFPRKTWEKIVGKLTQAPLTQKDARSFSRHLTYGAFEVDFDKLGRILIPNALRDYAQIKKSVIITGALDRVEIWDETILKQYNAKIEKSTDLIAERLSQLGI